MGTHDRLGSESPLRDMKDEVLQAILPPAVETPIQSRWVEDDDWINLRQPTMLIPISFTVIDNGVTVLRRPLLVGAIKKPSSAYNSRPFREGRVQFILSAKPGEAGINVYEFLHTETEVHDLQQAYCRTPKEIEAFRAKNELGIELLLSNDLTGRFTPLLMQ